MRVARRRRVLPRAARPGARHLGPPPGAGRARRGRRRARAVLHRPIPPRDADAARRGARAQRARCASRAARARRHRRSTTCRSSRRRAPRSYGRWGAWAAPSLARRLRACARSFAFDLVHAHNAVPAGDAVRRARRDAPLVVSVHGGDVFFTAPAPHGERAVRRGVRARAPRARQQRGHRRARARARRAATRASCTSAPTFPSRAAASREDADVVTVGHLVARKRHADVIRALWLLRERHPDAALPRSSATAPSASALERARRASSASPTASSSPASCRRDAGARARARAARCSCMPSIDEAFGVAYVEAMAGGRARRSAACGEPGPGGDRARRRRHAARAARRRRGARRRARRDALRARATCASSARARADGRRALHLGALRARDRRRLRGGARGERSPSCSSRTTSPPDRVGAFRALHERVGIELALFGGRSHHATGARRGPGRPAPRSRASARSRALAARAATAP